MHEKTPLLEQRSFCPASLASSPKRALSCVAKLQYKVRDSSCREIRRAPRLLTTQVKEADKCIDIVIWWNDKFGLRETYLECVASQVRTEISELAVRRSWFELMPLKIGEMITTRHNKQVPYA